MENPLAVKETFAVACKKFFGLKENQTSGDFMKELKDLTQQDRLDICEMFKTTLNCEITNPLPGNANQ